MAGFILKIFSKELIEMEVFQDFLSEQDIFWEDDFPFICSIVLKTIKDSNNYTIELFELFKDTDEKDFALNLLRHSIIHSYEFSELISSSKPFKTFGLLHLYKASSVVIALLDTSSDKHCSKVCIPNLPPICS